MNPKYETKSKNTALKGIVLITLLVAALSEMIYGLFIGKIPIEYLSGAVLLTIAIPSIVLTYFLSIGDADRKYLRQFINSFSDLIKVWCLARQRGYKRYTAYCQFNDGSFVQFEHGSLVDTSGEDPCSLYVSRYLAPPELVLKAPFIKNKPDKNILKYAILRGRNKEITKWKNSDERWKRLVIEDERIRLWMKQYCSWVNFRLAHSMPTEIHMVQIYGEECYERDPNKEDGWLKGEAFKVRFVFVPPATSDENELRGYYTEMIDIGKKIIQYIEESKGLTPQTKK